MRPFLPLTSVRPGIMAGFRQTGRPLKEAGSDRTGEIALVTVDPKYNGLASNLLGRTLVVDHIDHGIQIAGKYKQSIRIVTLEGELINPGGSMTGGAFKNTSNLLSRRREIEELEKAVQKLKAQMNDLEQSLSEKRTKRTGYYEKIELLKEELQKAYVVQNTAKMNLDQAEAKIHTSENMISDINRESEELEHEMSNISDNQESIQCRAGYIREDGAGVKCQN